MSIAVFLESYGGKMVKASFEAVTVAKILAEKTGKDMYGIILDDNIESVVLVAGKVGVTKVKVANNVSMYHPTMFARFISNAAKEATIVILPATVWGREIAPMVSVKLNGTPVLDIIGIENANTFTRSIHGNKLYSNISMNGKMIITVRVGIFDTAEESDGIAIVEEISPETVDSDNYMKLAEVLAASMDRPDLTEADIIVSGGRGTGGPENFEKYIEPLADAMGAAVGASRAVVDAGWRSHNDQVGQTGKFVSPKVYIAVGISGAIQHLAGMSSSDIIVAINKDPEAPIFKIADYGVVGDLFDVVPKLIEAINTAKSISV